MGVWITEDLLRKSSEHNECIISTMEEVALHQRNIDRITLLNSACRELRIIYLQNNNISRIENVNRLKELRYLNLAINKIRQVEGLHRCEWLTKLDFTVNRIDARGLLTCERLKDNEHLEELYLTGNPCTNIEGYRMFVITVLPQLQQLDGKDVLPSERTEARQHYAQIRRLIEAKAAEEELLPEVESESDSEDELEPEPEPSKFEGFGKTPVVKPATPGIEKDKHGRVRQCNQGGYKFHIDEGDEEVVVEVEISKFLDTSLVDCDIHPDFVRVTIKGKVLQLVLPCEVRTDTASAQRSTTTGSLLLRCPRLHPIMRHRHKLVGVAPAPEEPADVSAPETGHTKESAGGTAPGAFRAIAKDSPAAAEAAQRGQIEERSLEQARAAAAAVEQDVDDDAPPDLDF